MAVRPGGFVRSALRRLVQYDFDLAKSKTGRFDLKAKIISPGSSMARTSRSQPALSASCCPPGHRPLFPVR
jgi:hypothetical protein